MYDIEYTEDAIEDLAHFRRFEQVHILDETERQLTHEPSVQTRKRKQLRPNQTAAWE